MSRKKQEHVVFDRMLRIKTPINKKDYLSKNRRDTADNISRERNSKDFLPGVYWIGGSPCSGKSSVAELICKRHSLDYYKCDDHLEEYLQKGAEQGIRIMKKFLSMSMDETWLRRPVTEQVHDEILFYRAAFGMILQAVKERSAERGLLVEGAALMPPLMKNAGIKKYVCLVPTKEFQQEHYARREWVQPYLSACSDPEKAFENWMERDILFAVKMKKKAAEYGYKLIVEDGSKPVEERCAELSRYWGLG